MIHSTNRISINWAGYLQKQKWFLSANMQHNTGLDRKLVVLKKYFLSMSVYLNQNNLIFSEKLWLFSDPALYVVSSINMEPIVHYFIADCRRLESSNRPSLLPNLEKMRQTASQMWCLIRFLPQMIGHKVPEDNEYWGLFLLLRTIMDMIFAPVISLEATYSLEAIIDEHHSEYMRVCLIERALSGINIWCCGL